MCSLNYLRSTNNNLSDWKIHGVTCDKRNRGVFFSNIQLYGTHSCSSTEKFFVRLQLYSYSAYATYEKLAIYGARINNTCVYHATIFANYPYKIFIQFTILFICPNLSPNKQALGKPTSESGSRVAFSDVNKPRHCIWGWWWRLKEYQRQSIEAM